MASYRSRHQPRRHLVVTGKVLQPATYDRFYDIATDVVNAGGWPSMQMAAGTLLLRAVPSGTRKGDHFAKPIDVEGARQVPPNSAMNSFNRFSGRRLDGRPGQGALYVGTVAGSLREFVHYAMQRRRGEDGLKQPLPPRLWMPGKADEVRGFVKAGAGGQLDADPTPHNIFLYRLATRLSLADLRLPALATVMARLKATPAWAARYGLAAQARFDLLTAAVVDAQDYSAARGLADALADAAPRTGHAGICAHSSRADTENGLVLVDQDDATGGLVMALFGEPGFTVPSVRLQTDKEEAACSDLRKLLDGLTAKAPATASA